MRDLETFIQYHRGLIFSYCDKLIAVSERHCITQLRNFVKMDPHVMPGILPGQGTEYVSPSKQIFPSGKRDFLTLQKKVKLCIYCLSVF